MDERCSLTPSREGGRFPDFRLEPAEVPNLGLRGCSLPPAVLRCDLGLSPPPLSQAEQQKKAAIISAEGDSKAAELIANSLASAGDGLIELRKLEAAEDIAYQLSRSRNITYLPSGQSVLLQLPQ